MRISIFGLGYVGSVTSACLARDGHHIVGVDVSAEKVQRIGAGHSPVVEAGIDELLQAALAAGRLSATRSPAEAVAATDVSVVSVGTPSTPQGALDLSYVYEVCRQIAEAVREKGGEHVVVVRSTVPPGTLARCRAIMDEVAGPGVIHSAFNPEFLREGNALADYDNPPYTVIGTDDPVAADAVREMYAPIQSRVIVTDPPAAEMLKYVANTWHAAKVGFANEIGRIAREWGVDGRRVMQMLVEDTRFNISPAYMRPGFAYGGSCLPKDLGAILASARAMEVPVPFLSALPVSNQQQVELAARVVVDRGARRVTVLGLAFKPGTDDLRESPAVQLVKRLLGEGCQVRIYDAVVQPARLLGANREYIRARLPHFEAMLADEPAQALDGAEMVVVTQATREFRELLSTLPAGVPVLDVAGLYDGDAPEGMPVHALGWP